jgi:RimJ/RimL family protein N-acetyltransferase
MPIDVHLRDVTEADFPIFFQQQLDSEANRMAAFTTKDPADRESFTAKWTKILVDDTITKKAIVVEGRVIGYLAGFQRLGKPEVSYWLGREYWGKGLATKALTAFLSDVKVRPLYARAAKDNIASIRVLEKCGFTIVGQDKGFSQSRGEEVEEFILELL